MDHENIIKYRQNGGLSARPCHYDNKKCQFSRCLSFWHTSDHPTHQSICQFFQPLFRSQTGYGERVERVKKSLNTKNVIPIPKIRERDLEFALIGRVILISGGLMVPHQDPSSHRILLGMTIHLWYFTILSYCSPLYFILVPKQDVGNE